VIIVSFLPGQGLGNQLWLLFVGHAMANSYGMELRIHNHQNFKGWKLLNPHFRAKLIVIRSLSKLNDLVRLKSSLFFHKHGPLYYPHDLTAYQYIKLYDHVLLEDVCQSIHLLEQPARICEYLNEPIPPRSIVENKCIINVRGGDYLGFFKSPSVSIQYYHYAIQKMYSINPGLNFQIVTDDYRYAKLLFPEIPILEGDMESDFNALRTAEYLILANSSFAFFPLYTNRNLKFAIAPCRWAPSTRAQRTSSAWYSPSNYYPHLACYLEPSDGIVVNSLLSPFDVSLLSAPASIPSSTSLFHPLSDLVDTLDSNPIGSAVFTHLLQRIKKRVLYTYLRFKK